MMSHACGNDFGNGFGCCGGWRVDPVGCGALWYWRCHGDYLDQTRSRDGRPLTATSRPAAWLDPHEAFIVSMIGTTKDITLNEMVVRLREEAAVDISRSGLSVRLCGCGWAFKKGNPCSGAGPPRHSEAAAGVVRRPIGS